MTIPAFATGVASLGLGLHVATCVLAARRCRKGKPLDPTRLLPPVSIVQPLCGVEPYSRETLASIFALDHPDYEILFCLADGADPVIPLVQGFMAAHPHIPSRLLIGDDRVNGNPKLNNVVKGWKAATREWVVIADSNVLMPPDYLRRLLSRWRSDTGIVCAPPIGERAIGFAAALECAFLNTYQARWQYAGEAAGFGFAQGKSMLWRRATLEEAGGIEALGAELAEDAAATKLIHNCGLRAHLVDRPFAQPLGVRRLRDVWKRQLRWARLRRATFAIFFAPEILTTSLVTLGAIAIAAPVLALSPAVAVFLGALVWYGFEAALARLAGWPLGGWTLPALVVRDLMLPWLWVQGWAGDKFEWRGNAMTVAEDEWATDGVDQRTIQ